MRADATVDATVIKSSAMWPNKFAQGFFYQHSRLSNLQARQQARLEQTQEVHRLIYGDTDGEPASDGILGGAGGHSIVGGTGGRDGRTSGSTTSKRRGSGDHLPRKRPTPPVRKASLPNLVTSSSSVEPGRRPLSAIQGDAVAMVNFQPVATTSAPLPQQQQQSIIPAAAAVAGLQSQQHQQRAALRYPPHAMATFVPLATIGWVPTIPPQQQQHQQQQLSSSAHNVEHKILTSVEGLQVQSLHHHHHHHLVRHISAGAQVLSPTTSAPVATASFSPALRSSGGGSIGWPQHQQTHPSNTRPSAPTLSAPTLSAPTNVPPPALANQPRDPFALALGVLEVDDPQFLAAMASAPHDGDWTSCGGARVAGQLRSPFEKCALGAGHHAKAADSDRCVPPGWEQLFTQWSLDGSDQGLDQQWSVCL